MSKFGHDSLALPVTLVQSDSAANVTLFWPSWAVVFGTESSTNLKAFAKEESRMPPLDNVAPLVLEMVRVAAVPEFVIRPPPESPVQAEAIHGRRRGSATVGVTRLFTLLFFR